VGSSIKYLGIDMMSGSSLNQTKPDKKIIAYRSINAKLRNGSGTSDLTKLYLRESYYFPALSYATESLNRDKTTVRKLNVY